MRVLISDNFSADSLQLLSSAADITVDYRPGISPSELLSAIGEVDALLVRGGTSVTAELLEAAPKLKIIARAGIGVENIDIDAANKYGIVVTNTPTGSTTTIAEHAIAMMLALARMIPQAYISVRQGQWSSAKFIGTELSGKTLGIVGGGKIGRKVIEYAHGLHMNVNLYDPYLSAEVIKRLGASKVSFDALLQSADFISLHVPLNHETDQLFNADTFRRLKPGCRLINCAIGGLVNETDMAEALTSGILAGAALDTFTKEPPMPNNPLLAMPNVIYTPHMRAATIDAQTNVTMQAANQVINFLTTGIVRNALNVPSVSSDLLDTLRPYLSLGEKMGAFLAQLLENRPFDSISIEYSGTLIQQSTEPITSAILKGLLTPIIGPRINYVNAPHIIRKRGITVNEIRSNIAAGFSNIIKLTISGEQGCQSIQGAMFHNNEGRIVGVDDYSVETIPAGNILVVKNNDRPGVVALLGAMMADENINVAMMNLSRRKINGTAMSLLTVDQKISEDTMKKLRQHDNIISAIQVELPEQQAL
ncbi:MAG: phosphoglycerate dehydrogenase [Desulfuromonas sp.]|nr:phosphoglycerate dehydrogenase [Desulfuromonas sp.]